MTASSIQLDHKLFNRRLSLLQSRFKNAKKSPTDPLSRVDAIVLKVGVPDDSTVYQKSTALHFWFFGYEFPETIIAITTDSMKVLTSMKKGAIMETITASDNSIPLSILKKGKDPAEQGPLFEKLCDFISQSKSGSLTLGILPKDKAVSPLIADWDQYMDKQSSKPTTVDISSFISSLLSIKDEDEQNLTKLASRCSAAIMQDYVMDQILSIVDDEKKITHEQLSEKIENVIAMTDGGKRPKNVKFPSSVQLEYAEMCYPPIIQSGGTYSLKPSAISNSDNLHFGTILCALGVRYRSYCSNIARTFLIEPTKQQEKDYEFLLELQKYILDTLIKPGTLFKDVYNKSVEYVKKHRPDLEKHLVPNFGFSMGIEFRESEYLINSKAEKSLEPGMIINLAVGFSDIPKDGFKKGEDEKTKLFSLLFSDTILVTDSAPQILTTEILKKLEDVSYYFKNEEEEEEEEEADRHATPEKRVMKTRYRQEHKAIDESTMKKREEHQEQLLKRIIRDAMAKYSDGASDEQGQKKVAFKEFECYKKDIFIPKEVKDLKIYVDKRNECIVVPISGMPVPFHMSTIKNTSKSEEGEFIYLRINFNSPGRTVGRQKDPLLTLPFDDPSAHFVRALTFRSSDTFHMNSIFKEIAELKKTIAAKEAETKERADLVQQDNLIEIKGHRPIRLPDVLMRPAMEGKRLPGELEIHSNGIRYRNMLKSDQRCDILFSNIKQVFFQPCDNELVVLIHFHLKNPIMIGKKKTKDVQFFREALESSADETGSRRRRATYGDEDEIIQEQEERKQRAALNQEFKDFCEKLNSAHESLRIDVPIRELGFYGVPFRQNVLLQPTGDYLVYLSDPPFLTLSLSDVEIASLERVHFGLKNFDLVFVFKDHSIPPQHIDAVPMNYLEPIKDWLDSSDVYYITSNINFNWNNVMKTVQDDPIGFYDMGGWEVIHNNPDKPALSSEEEEDSVYEDEDDEDEDEEYSDEDEDDEDEYSDEEDEEDEEYSDEEEDEYSDEEEDEGPDWDELEEEAIKEDKAKHGKNEKMAPKRKR